MLAQPGLSQQVENPKDRFLGFLVTQLIWLCKSITKLEREYMYIFFKNYKISETSDT